MQLTTVISKQQARTMVPVTRRGSIWYIAGSRGDTYEVEPFVYLDTGEISFSCSCTDYTGAKDGKSFRRSKYDTRQTCKHGRLVSELLGKRG